jgi:uncharacterized lipoprotein YddW (UPF0748 family)
MAARACRVAISFLLALGALSGGGAQAQAAESASTLSEQLATTLMSAVIRDAGLEGRVMWIDATANLERLTSRESIAGIMERCRLARFNTVVLDVKPLSGHVLYSSRIAPRLAEWRGVSFPADLDPLQIAMLEGRRRGLQVYASINVFSDAHKLVRSGPLYERPDWQAVVYDVERVVTAADGVTHPLTVGVNVGPTGDGIAAYDQSYRQLRRLESNEVGVVVEGTRVTAVVDGALTDRGGLRVPEGGHLLIGRGRGGEWLLAHLPVDTEVRYTAKELLQPILEAPSEPVGAFVNPSHPEAQEYLIRLIAELADRYALDGLVLDRMRYSSLRTDFSPLSREQFEAHVGKKLDAFPQDIFTYDPVPGRPIIPGPYFREWLEWRARVITDFLERARREARRVRPGLGLGVYVGSWYETYYHVGVNWGADDFRPGYDWMTPTYSSTGYASRLNWLTTGCYYGVATRDDARQLGTNEEATVEAAAETSVRAVNGASFVYAGVNALDYEGRPEEFRKAMQSALGASQGVMVFDLVYIERWNWWDLFGEVFADRRRAPHEAPGLLEALRLTREAVRSFQSGRAMGQ